MEEYIEFALKPSIIDRALRNTLSAIDSAQQIIKEALVYKNTIKQFFSKIKTHQKDIDQLGKAAADSLIFNGEQIVHYLLKEYKSKI